MKVSQMIHEATLKMLADLQVAGLHATFNYRGILRSGRIEGLTETNVTLYLDVEQGPITSRQRPQTTRYKTFKIAEIENLVW